MKILILLAVLANDDAAERVRGALGGVPGAGAWTDAAPQENDYKALKDTNLFAPWKPAPPPPKEKPAPPPPKEKPPPPPAAPPPILVTGFYFNENDKRFEVVIEDKSKKEIRYLKPGDTVDGWTIKSVTHDRMVCEKDKKEHEFKLGETVNGVAPPPRELDHKEILGEAEVDPKKLEEARARLRERGKKKVVDDEAEEPTVEKKKNPKPE